MKIAIAHDYLIQMGGAERVVEVFHHMYPGLQSTQRFLTEAALLTISKMRIYVPPGCKRYRG